MVLESNGTSSVEGCSTICTDKNHAGGVGYCSSNGCCQADITGDSFVGAELIDLSRRLGRRKMFPCSYAFIQERRNRNETLFSYPLHYMDDLTTLLNDNWESTPRPPVVRLNWIINGAENCSRAKLNSTTYACRDNKSICVEANDVSRGYTCSLVQGYEGNPYLPGGCQQSDFNADICHCLSMARPKIKEA